MKIAIRDRGSLHIIPINSNSDTKVRKCRRQRDRYRRNRRNNNGPTTSGRPTRNNRALYWGDLSTFRVIFLST